MDVIIAPLFKLLFMIIEFYMWVVIISVVLSWLTQFNVINMSNRFVYTISVALYRLTEPVLGRIRRVLPNLGGLDLSPLVLIAGLVVLKEFLFRLALKIV